MKKGCHGNISIERGDLVVDCTECSGPGDISDRRCFTGLSEKLTPGFRGNVILSSRSDEMFGGPAVEALSASSDILARMSILRDSLDGIRIDRRIRMKRLVDRLVGSYMEDPEKMVRSRREMEKEAGKVIGSENDPILDGLADIYEMTERMIRRLERQA